MTRYDNHREEMSELEYRRASPKSTSLTCPASVKMMFAGLQIPMDDPFSCAYSRASAICRAIAVTSPSSIRPC